MNAAVLTPFAYWRKCDFQVHTPRDPNWVGARPVGQGEIIKETGVAATEALMIGDSSIDVLTGRNAGLWTCGVTYGFAPHTLEEVPPDVLIDSPRELGELLG